MPEDQNIRICDIIGNFGKYQFALMFINIIASMFAGFGLVFIELIAPSVTLYWSWESLNPNKTTFKSIECELAEVYQYNKNSNESNSSSRLIYDSVYSKRTLTEELNLVCERSWLVSLAKTLGVFGLYFGILVYTRITEIYGRTKSTVWMALLNVITNILMLFPKGYIMFVVSYILYSTTNGVLTTFIFFQVLEIAPISWAEYAGTFMKAGLLLGQTLLVVIAWLLEDWFYTQVFQTLLAGIFFLSSLYLLESPVWLAVRGRYKEAEITINRIIVRNNLNLEAAKPMVNSYLEQMKRRCEIESTAEKGKFSDLFKNRIIALYTLAMSVSRALQFFLYLGLIMNAESFGSGLYVDLTISNCLALGCFLITVSLLRKFSLRSQTIFLCSCSGITCIAYAFFYENPLARSALIILGRCFMSPATTMSEVFTTQVFPTSVRGVSAAFRSAVSGLITSFTPFTKELGEMTAEYVPFVLFALCGFASAGLFKFLPEPKGKEMVHTVDELVKWKTKKPKAVYTISTRL